MSFLLVIPLSTIVSRFCITAFLIQWDLKIFDAKMECFRLLIALLFFPLSVLEERNCSDPGDPVNGYKKITGGPGLINGRYAKIGTVLTFFCNNSYVLSGNEMRTCQQNGEWSGKQPICIKGNLQIFLKSVEIDGVDGHFGSSHTCFWATGKMPSLLGSHWNHTSLLGWKSSIKHLLLFWIAKGPVYPNHNVLMWSRRVM